MFFRRIGPLGLVFGAYRAWQRLSPDQQQKIKAHVRGLRARSRRPTAASVPRSGSMLVRINAGTAWPELGSVRPRRSNDEVLGGRSL